MEEALVKAIALQSITVDGKKWIEGDEVSMTQQRFDSYLTVGAVKAISQAPEVITAPSIPKYLGIESPVLVDLNEALVVGEEF